MENLDEFFSESIDGWDGADVANVLSFFLLGAGPPHSLLMLLATCHMLPTAWLVAGVTADEMDYFANPAFGASILSLAWVVSALPQGGFEFATSRSGVATR